MRADHTHRVVKQKNCWPLNTYSQQSEKLSRRIQESVVRKDLRILDSDQTAESRRRSSRNVSVAL
jgi:hypothetical protein